MTSLTTSPQWSDLRRRVLSAVILAPAVLVCIWYGDWPFDVVMILVGVGLAFEWVRMGGQSVFALPGVAVLGAVFLASLAIVLGYPGVGLVILGVAVAGLLLAPGQARMAALGATYIGLGVLSLLWLRDDPVVGRANLFFVLVLIWASDIGAYLTGRALGGPRLAPSISPGKTRSGAVGGMLSAILASGILAYSVQPPTSIVWLIGISAVLGIIAQSGDLFESMIKRHFGVKDSGRIIPGHGGLLDRLDALLAAAPVAALLALTAGRGVVLWQ